MYSRTLHQPTKEIIKRKKPSNSELKKNCGKTAAFILATNLGTDPLKVQSDIAQKEPMQCNEDVRPLQKWHKKTVLEHSFECAQNCNFAQLSIIASPKLKLPKKIDRQAGTQTKIIEYSAQKDIQASEQSGFFDLFSITKGILDIAWEHIEDKPEIDSVIFLSCDQVRLTPAHIMEVCKDFRDNTKLDCVTSWIAWTRNTPILVSRTFLGGHIYKISANERMSKMIKIKDHNFGEERLDSNAPQNINVKDFEKDCSISAREAVRIAHEQLKLGKAHKNKKSKKDLNNADALLIQAAHESIVELKKSLSLSNKRHLLQADTWGKEQVKNFPLLFDSKHKNTLVFLDSAATTQRCFQALQAQEDFDKHENANVYRGAYELSAKATASLNDARAKLENYIGAKRRETVFTKNASDSLNLVALAWGEHNINEGDLIISTIAEHHSNYLPWLALAQRKGARVEAIPLLNDGRLDLETYNKLLKQKPKLVCVAHVSNVLGIKNPIEKMAKAAHLNGARFVLDAAQSLPHSRLNVYKTGADFIAFSAHKMYAPFGIGALWIHPDAFEEMDPLSVGGGTISHASIDSYYLRLGAIQYEVGTPAISESIAWGGALDYINSINEDERQNHKVAMTKALDAGLKKIWGVYVWGDHKKSDGQNGLVSFSLAGVTPPQLATFCGNRGVAIRAGSHCAIPLSGAMGAIGTGRASIAVHTTLEDIEALLCCVRLCSKLYWGM